VKSTLTRFWPTGVLTTVVLVAVGARPGAAGDAIHDPTQKASAAVMAREIDASLASELAGEESSASATTTKTTTDDETFLRRISQDLVGQVPSPEEITAFVLDPAADKRAKAVDRLLADPRFGKNWARYFRDVILFRRTDERGLIAGPGIVAFLAEQFNSGAGWDKIARAFITARGDVRENGSTGLIMAQMGQPPEIAAETARIFLGVQIQCAQCHDHPTDRWKRQQFHELAAFFPRIAIRPVRDGEKRVSFEVVSRDSRGPANPKNDKFRGNAEHFMPDLKDPSAKGTMMEPVFFVTGEKISLGTKDVDRREALADWITDRQDPWFARAFVNRIWAELVGQGFYDPVDDLGPDRKASAPKTLDLLSVAFADRGYDVKWLMRTIMSTGIYQHETRSHQDGDESSFVANCPQPLRADQVFDALVSALGIDEAALMPPLPQGAKGPARFVRGPRGEFDRTFGFDPSAPRDELGATIPQALLMMNSPLLNRAINATRPGTILEKLLAAESDNEAVTSELYLRCLAREPKPDELAACLAYVERNHDRAEAFEDIQWALLNSTEFTHRK
jgi:hypothetical protein